MRLASHFEKPLSGENVGDRVFLRNRRKARVSIIVGIFCRHGIVLASDSQTTYTSADGDAMRRIETSKISVAEFSHDAVLVAEAGEASLSGRAVDFFKQLSAGKDMSDYRTAADLALESLAQVRQELRKQHFGCSAEELNRIIRDQGLNFQLMIAHYHDAKPYIFTVNFETGSSKKCVQPFESIGCGSGIATYILNRFNIGKDFQFNHGMLAALYAIEETKKVDPFCGGRTRIAVIAPKMESTDKTLPTKAAILRNMLESVYDHYLNLLTEMDCQAKAEWENRMNKVLRKVHESSMTKKISPAGMNSTVS